MCITPEQLIALHPTLFHVSLASWEQVKEQGLLSTSSLLDHYGVQDKDRVMLERKPRISTEPIRREIDRAMALLNDQSPWTESVQRRCALPEDMLVADWMQYLNGHVFFWPTWDRLEVFYYAIRATERKRIILEVDTRSLLDRVGTDNVLLHRKIPGRLMAETLLPGLNSPPWKNTHLITGRSVIVPSTRLLLKSSFPARSV